MGACQGKGQTPETLNSVVPAAAVEESTKGKAPVAWEGEASHDDTQDRHRSVRRQPVVFLRLTAFLTPQDSAYTEADTPCETPAQDDGAGIAEHLRKKVRPADLKARKDKAEQKRACKIDAKFWERQDKLSALKAATTTLEEEQEEEKEIEAAVADYASSTTQVTNVTILSLDDGSLCIGTADINTEEAMNASAFNPDLAHH